MGLNTSIFQPIADILFLIQWKNRMNLVIVLQHETFEFFTIRFFLLVKNLRFDKCLIMFEWENSSKTLRKKRRKRLCRSVYNDMKASKRENRTFHIDTGQVVQMCSFLRHVEFVIMTISHFEFTFSKDINTIDVHWFDSKLFRLDLIEKQKWVTFHAGTNDSISLTYLVWGEEYCEKRYDFRKCLIREIIKNN